MISSDIVFCGYYGQENAGDDAFVEVSSWGAKKIWNKQSIKYLGKKSKLPITKFEKSGYYFDLPRTYKLQANLMLRNTKCLISAGGSTIYGKLAKNNPKNIGFRLKEKNNDFKIGAIGVSIGPFKSLGDEKAVINYLKGIDFIALRDKRSFEFVNSINTSYKAVQSFDLAALLPEIYNYNKTIPSKNLIVEKQKVIGVSICPFESKQFQGDLLNEERRVAKLIELIKKLDSMDNFIFRFYIVNGNDTKGDLRLTNEVINRSQIKSYSVFNYNRETEKMWIDINSCNAVISTRLHGAIFACFGKTPFMLVEYHTKCIDFLNDIGYNNEYRIFDAEFDVMEKANLLVEWCNYPETFMEPKFLQERIDDSRLNFTAINI